ncbi:aminotransferase class IV [Myxosarcina sp. GI1(2024)]
MYWYDGELNHQDTLQLSIKDPGLLYGTTVFTTMRVYGCSLSHSLTNWKAHCGRLKESLITFDWQQPNWQRIRRGSEILSASFPVVRIAIFFDGRELITGRELPPDLARRQQQGITAWVARESIFRRDLAAYKTGNYLGAYLALQQAYKQDATEAILVDSKGNWLETSTGNLWGWRDGCWFTPALESGILPGIARAQLLSWLRADRIHVRENLWTPEFVRDLQALAYSNCAVEILPIHTVRDKNDRIYPQKQVHEQLRGYFSSYHTNTNNFLQ